MGGHFAFDNCDEVIETDLELGYDICGLNSAGEIDNNLCINSNQIDAFLRGWRDRWIFTAGLGDGAAADCVDPVHPDFGGIPASTGGGPISTSIRTQRGTRLAVMRWRH